MKIHMNLPNRLTLGRIIVIPIYMIFAFPYPDWDWIVFRDFMNGYGRYIALALFITACITDMLDGKIARSKNLVTDFGKFADPVADKLLVTVALLSLIQYSKFYLWSAMIILAREFTVTGLRLVAASKNIVVPAGPLGKIKTVTQMVAIIVLQIAFLIQYAPPFAKTQPYYDFGVLLQNIGGIIMAIAVIFTIVSGIDYIKKNAKVLMGSI